MNVRTRARRLRELAPPRRGVLDSLLERGRYGRALTARLLAADVEATPAGFVKGSAAAACAGALAAMLWAGPWAGVGGVVVGAAAPEVWLRRRISRRSARVLAQMPDVLAGLAAPVRAGASLPLAFSAAAEEAEAPMKEILARTCRDLDAGIPQDDAIDRFAARCAIPESTLVARALRVGRHAGTDLARVIDEVSETLRERERLAREMHAATAQARLSALVVAALPVVFLLLTSAGAHEQAKLLFGEPVGWVLLGIGGLLESAGLLWIRKLTRGKLA